MSAERRLEMKGSLIIVGFFVLGIIVGVWDVIPASFLASDVSYYALCCLMFCVGISIGCRRVCPAPQCAATRPTCKRTWNKASG